MNNHGKVYLSWEGHLLISKVEGPFNKGGVAACTSLLQESVLTRSVTEWKWLEIWDDEVLGSPEAIELAKELYDWCDDNGCILMAIVVSNLLQRHIIKDMLKRRAKVFSNIDEARQWLKSHSDYSIEPTKKQ